MSSHAKRALGAEESNSPSKVIKTTEMKRHEDESGPEKHEKKDVTDLTVVCRELGVKVRAGLTFTATMTMVEDGTPIPKGMKKVHLIRHGQGYHNVAQAEWRAAGKPGEPYWLSTDPAWRYLDAELTPVGVAQAEALRARAAGLEPGLLVVSPMRRATQTGLIAFDAHVNRGGNGGGNGGGGGGGGGGGDDDGETKEEQIAKAAVALPALKVVAHESAHEIAGKHTCDKRLPKAELAARFPAVDYGLLESEEDPFWGDGKVREAQASVAARGAALLAFLRSRVEDHIVVAAHSNILFTLMNAVVEVGGEEAAAAAATAWFGTGEMRTFLLDMQDKA